ncbi:hypothetical protein LINGRAHAP2_LOCUS12838 [Linum grandiflorum]
MNIAAKSSIYNNLLLLHHQSSSSTTTAFQLRAAALFHSSPVLERKRGGGSYSGYSRPNFSSRRNRKLHGKENLLRNIRAYADTLFQGWEDDHKEGPSSNKEPSWFRTQYPKGPKNTNARSNRWDKRGFDFCADDVEVETIFRSAFGGSSRYSYWSFINDEQPQWKKSSWYSKRFRFQEDVDYESEFESDSTSSSPVVGMVSERRTLGLRPSGPLNLEDVKSA